MAGDHDERSPLLQNGHADEGGEGEVITIEFEEGDPDNPRNWSPPKKWVNVGIIALMAVLSPLASSMFTPGISQIAKDLNTDDANVVWATTGFVVSLGIGPLVLAPLSETFGRRKLYVICFAVFAITQVPTALSRNVGELVAWRTVSGFFGSVGIANGGGTLSDMFDPSERAAVFGWYLLGPLLGPTLGPLFGGLIVQTLNWRWIFWILTIVCTTNTLVGFFFLHESYAPAILSSRKQSHSSSSSTNKTFRLANQDDRPLPTKLAHSMLRPLRILFTQPVVLTMSIYQAILFGTTYSLYTNFESIYKYQYNFSTVQVGLMYLFPGLGFLAAVLFLVPRIDTVYNALTRKNNGEAKPEFRLPLANIGAVLVPASLFWFAWTVEYHAPWPVTILATVFFGLGLVTILNTVQNYYIDSFSKYAASAIAAGAVFRSIIGGVVPLAAPGIFERLGYGWGVSVFAFASLALAPAPLLFMRVGPWLREKFAIEL